MGIINIEMLGSFPQAKKSFPAIDHGHAHAVARAIAWLSEDVLPWAISKDHELHEQGAKPTRGFNT